MAVPKRKVSHARKSKRRSSVWKLNVPALAKCSKCGEYTAPHKVCIDIICESKYQIHFIRPNSAIYKFILFKIPKQSI